MSSSAFATTGVSSAGWRPETDSAFRDPPRCRPPQPNGRNPRDRCRSSLPPDPVPASALVRGFRRRRGRAVSGPARDPLVLVPDVARAASRARAWFSHDVRVAETLKETNPGLRIGFVGAHVAVNPERALSASTAIDFVARNEFDFTIADVARGGRLETVLG